MKRIKYLLIGVFLILINSYNVYASSWASISGNNSVIQGNSIDVSATVGADTAVFFIEGTFKCSGAGVDKSIDLNWDNMDNSKKSNTKSMNITPKNVGTITCTVSGRATGAGWTGWQNVSASKTIQVNKPREKSNNNDLKSLSVEGYTLSPEFSKDTLEYTVEVTDDKEIVTINASRADDYSSVEGTGDKEVAEGANKFEVKVTSETGKEKVYVLNINVKDTNPIEKKIDKDTYSLVKRSKSLTVPSGLDEEKFELTTIQLDEIEIPALVSEELKITLVGLKDKNDVIYLYKVEDGNITTRYELLTTQGLSIEFKEPKKVIDGYKKTAVKIDNKEYTAYQNKYKDYVLVYGTNIETKEDNWYSYNIKEKTLQTYNSALIDDLNKDHNKEINNYKTLLYSVSGVAGVLLFIIIILIILLVSKKKKYVEPTIKKEEKKEIKEIDNQEIIINKVESKKKEEKEEKKDSKSKKVSKKKEDKNQDEFLNADDIKEILEEPKIESKPAKKKKNSVFEDEEMALDFLDEKQKRRRKK